MTFQRCNSLLIARSDWNARLKCHNTALYSLTRTFVWSELQITAGAWEKASARMADAAAAAARSRKQLTWSEFVAQSSTCSAPACLNKNVLEAESITSPSIIDGHLLMWLRLSRWSLLMFYWWSVSWNDCSCSHRVHLSDLMDIKR